MVRIEEVRAAYQAVALACDPPVEADAYAPNRVTVHVRSLDKVKRLQARAMQLQFPGVVISVVARNPTSNLPCADETCEGVIPWANPSIDEGIAAVTIPSPTPPVGSFLKCSVSRWSGMWWSRKPLRRCRGPGGNS
jgi:hypothetical protein